MGQHNCLYCGTPLVRKTDRKNAERTRDFMNRKFCDKVCAGKYSQTKQPESAGNTVKQAEKDLKSGNVESAISAYEYLERLINNEDADNYLRLNAAKALIPYQAKRKGEGSVNKKEERQEAAERVAQGKFQPGAPPAKIVNINGSK